MLAVLGIVLSVGALSTNVFAKVQDQRALVNDVTLLHKTFLEARNGAIMDGRIRQVIVSTDCVYVQTLFPGGTTTTKYSYHKNLRLITNTYSSKKLIFYPVGTVSSGGTITFQNKSGTKKSIIVQVGSGRIYIREGS